MSFVSKDIPSEFAKQTRIRFYENLVTSLRLRSLYFLQSYWLYMLATLVSVALATVAPLVGWGGKENFPMEVLF